MLSRRELITGGLAGTAALPHGDGPPPAQSREEIDMLRDIARRIDGIDSTLGRGLLSNAIVFGLAAKVRAQMETFFRANQKFPDFVEVGYNVFMDLYDWHVKNRQQLVVTRGPDGRYWLQFMFTTIIMRGEQDANYIGIPYDKS